MSLLDGVLVAGAALMALRAAHLALVLRSIPRLDRVEPAPAALSPSVTIAVAARDEGEHLEAAVRSWLAQDLPRLQVVAVDDRSKDATGAILQRLAAEDPRVTALRIDERPAGWLGKCHALSAAAARATGELVLFTDADVRLAPDALRRAAAVLERDDADALTLLPEVESTGVAQRAMTATFFQFFLTALGGLGANRDDGRCVVGVGAFNLVRRSAYEAAGGHEPVRLMVGDDVALVRVLQHARFRHRLLDGTGLVSLRWQPGLWGLVRGLEKNFFWGARFSLALLTGFSIASLLTLAPLLAPLSGTLAAWLSLGAWAVATAVPHLLAARPAVALAHAALHPLSTVLLVVTGWNSAIRTLARGGISWRGDVVPMAELRAALPPWRWWRVPVRARPARDPAVRSSEPAP